MISTVAHLSSVIDISRQRLGQVFVFADVGRQFDFWLRMNQA